MSRQLEGVVRVRSDAGFTLVEAMVAMVVMAVGVLGLAGTAAVMTRQMGSGSRMARGAVLARSRIENLGAQNCAALQSGSASVAGFTELWTVTAVSHAVRVTETVTFRGERQQRAQTYTTMLPCPANP
jgi:prepilin-type N-terminal cleavage/methylation domain-containing protein